MSRDARLYLDDILESIQAIVGYTNDVTREKLFETPLILDAVLRRLEIIGEESAILDIRSSLE